MLLRLTDCGWPNDGMFNAVVIDHSPSGDSGIDSAVYDYVAGPEEVVTFSTPTTCMHPGQRYDVALVQFVP